MALAETFDEVIAVEASPNAVADLKHNAPRNVRPSRATTEEFLEKRGDGLGGRFCAGRSSPRRAGR